ncbi:hypothetical protein TNCV_1400641 [Trichonephila clavipes]|nr:hypothetical protein TNCV_1400641 [Trichonephila clavipes]
MRKWVRAPVFRTMHGGVNLFLSIAMEVNQKIRENRRFRKRLKRKSCSAMALFTSQAAPFFEENRDNGTKKNYGSKPCFFQKSATEKDKIKWQKLVNKIKETENSLISAAETSASAEQKGSVSKKETLVHKRQSTRHSQHVQVSRTANSAPSD